MQNKFIESYSKKFPDIQNPIVKFSSYYLGLGVLKFCLDLYSYAYRHEIRKIYFVSREGVFLQGVFECFLKSNERLKKIECKPIYISRVSSEKKLFDSYLAQHQLNSQCLFVDVGWGGTIERTIRKFQTGANFFYFGCSSRYRDLFKRNTSFVNLNHKGKEVDIKTALGFIEYSLTPHGGKTTLDYIMHNNICIPILDESISDEKSSIHYDINVILGELVSSLELSEIKIYVESNWKSYWEDVVLLKSITPPKELENIKFDMGGYMVPILVNIKNRPCYFFSMAKKGTWVRGSLKVSKLYWLNPFVQVAIKYYEKRKYIF